MWLPFVLVELITSVQLQLGDHERSFVRLFVFSTKRKFAFDCAAEAGWLRAIVILIFDEECVDCCKQLCFTLDFWRDDRSCLQRARPTRALSF